MHFIGLAFSRPAGFSHLSIIRKLLLEMHIIMLLITNMISTYHNFPIIFTYKINCVPYTKFK